MRIFKFRLKKIVNAVVWWSALCAVIFLSVFYAFPALSSNGEAGESRTDRPVVLSLWHIDTFEGGKGSRASFLKNAALSYCKSKDAIIMVSSYSAAGARAAFGQGEMPDMLSFGIGLNADPAMFSSLKISEIISAEAEKQTLKTLNCAGASEKNGGEAVAVPWCCGCYALYSESEDFSRVSADTALISSGGNNLASVAAALRLGGVKSGSLKESTAAYADFLSGKSEYLLGTQRDAYRFCTRGVKVRAEAVTEYNDLYQYIGVTRKKQSESDGGRRAEEECAAFLKYLLSFQVQSTLYKTGMFSPYFKIYASIAAESAEKALSAELESGWFETGVKRSIGVFLSDAAYAEADKYAREGNVTALKKILKTL
ncbi:MAG: hypothetical protein ACI4RO_05790 [Candidatus Scatosoma sp.]